MSLGQSYTRANPSNSYWCTCLHGLLSSFLVSLGQLNTCKTLQQWGPVGMHWVKTRCLFAFKYSFTGCLLIPVLSETGMCWLLLTAGRQVFSVMVPYLCLPDSIPCSASHAKQRGVTVPVLSNFHVRMLTSQCHLLPECGGAPKPHGCPSHQCKHGFAPWVCAFASEHLWLGSDLKSEKSKCYCS